MGDTSQNGSGVPADQSLEGKIIKQVEFYFGDVNYIRDKFLQAEAKKNENGWIPIDVLTTFNRMKVLSTDIEVLAAALRKSDSGIIEVSEDGKNIRRAKAMPENSVEYWQDVKSRTAYVKRFPVDTQLDALQDFFKQFGNVERVFMRRVVKDEKRPFKGSVFVTFASRDDAVKFIELPEVTFGDEKLIRMLQDQYFKQFDSRKRGGKEAAAKPAAEGEAAQDQSKSYTKGMVIHLTGLPKKGATPRNLKELFDASKIDWVNVDNEKDEAFVRCKGEENVAEEMVKESSAQNEGKFMVGDTEIKVEVLQDEAEKAYWESLSASPSGRGGRGRGRGGRGRGRGRGRGARGGRRGGSRGDRGNKDDANGDNDDDDKQMSSDYESDVEEKARAELTHEKRLAERQDDDAPAEKKPKVEADG